MKKKPKKEVVRMDGLLIPELMNHIHGLPKQLLENMIAANKSLESARASNARSSLTILDFVLNYVNKANLPVVQMTRAIIKQIPNAKYN